MRLKCAATLGTPEMSTSSWVARRLLTGLLADATWAPMATVHFTAMTAALLAGWMAVRTKGYCF
jgi:hypothetical protein